MKFESTFNSMQEKLTNFLMPIATKLGNQRHLDAVRQGITILIPLTIIGGFSILLAQPPVNPETMTDSNFFFKFLLTWYNWANANSSVLMLPYNLTFGLISIYVSFSVAYRLAEKYNLPKIESGFTSMLCFLSISSIIQSTDAGNVLTMENLSATGMFTAIIIAILTVEISHVFFKYNITIKMPASVPPNVASPFKILIPMIFNIVGLILLNLLCIHLSGDTLCNLLLHLLQPLLSASESLPSILLLLLLSQCFWFFGIHGDNMIGAVLTPITTSNIALNLEAYNAGQEMTHIFAGSFNGIWAGWTMQWAMLIAMLIIAKSQHLKKLSHLAPVSTLFNINEPLVFGTPTVLNSMIIIPQLAILIFNITVAYIFTYFNIIGKCFMVLPWTTPVPIAAFLTTMDIKALFLWIGLLIIDIFIMLPFIKMYDKSLIEDEK